MDINKELYFLKELYFGTIHSLVQLDDKTKKVSFSDDFKTGIFVLNNQKTRAINVLDDKEYYVFNFYSQIKHPVLKKKMFQQQGSEVVSQVFPLKQTLKEYYIKYKNDIFDREELTKINNKLYEEVLKDLNISNVKKEKEIELTK